MPMNMKIVLLEDLGVSKQIIDQHSEKLKSMGHTFIAYQKSNDINILIERCQDADILMLANMPLDKQVIENAPKLKYIDVAFTGVDHLPMDVIKNKNIAGATIILFSIHITINNRKIIARYILFFETIVSKTFLLLFCIYFSPYILSIIFYLEK